MRATARIEVPSWKAWRKRWMERTEEEDMRTRGFPSEREKNRLTMRLGKPVA